MTESITVIEIKRRAEQGRSRPFLCRGDDDKWYWVKGNGAGKAALCREWIAGRIAQAFGLPIPRFVQAEVPWELVEFSAVEGVRDLGAGVAFGSEHVEGADDLTYSEIGDVPEDVRRKTLVFDWWVQNEDRILGENGGNVNVLRVATSQSVFVIDHNLAFDATFDAARWRSDHVFRTELDTWPDGFGVALEPDMRDIGSRLDAFWAELPDEWIETATLLPEVSLARLHAVLGRFRTADSLFGRVTR